MKLTKRMKNSILQWIAFGLLFLVVLLVSVFVFIYPKIQEIWIKKEEFITTYKSFENVKKKGVSYGDFKSGLSPDISWNADLIVRNLDKDFFTNNFTNTWSKLYEEYIKDLAERVKKEKSSDEFIKKEEALQRLLPTYIQNNSLVWWESTSDFLTNFYFINFMENLLYTFNLSYDGEIWIGNLENVKDDQEDSISSPKDAKSWLQEDVYRIPLSLSIVWKKSDIIDFIHYFENVSKISISDDSFSVDSDSFINKRIEWSLPSANYNIYENQVADISSISFSEYPDSSPLETGWLIAAMKGAQSREEFSVDIDLSFYVAGVPWYKMQNFIQKFVEDQKTFSQEVREKAQKYGAKKNTYSSESEALVAIQNMQSVSLLMTSLDEDIKKILPRLSKWENITELYEEVLDMSSRLNTLKSYFEKQIEIVTNQQQ